MQDYAAELGTQEATHLQSSTKPAPSRRGAPQAARAPPTLPPQPHPPALRVNEAQALLGVSRSKIYAMIKTGELRTIKLGRTMRIVTDSLFKLIEV
jgi:excisionase family DNA binding protein